jgi:2-oxoglutarate ferredoxin oxidoreductase subunit gamma
MKVRMAGFGGQGQVTAGILLGHSVVLEGRHVLQTQSYGSATRGGLTTCDVCTGEGEIHEVHPERFDVLVAFSQEACDTFVSLLEDDGVLIYEQDLVTPPADLAQRSAASPTTRLAKDELGKVICANVVMLGFLVGAVPEIVDAAKVETAIEQQLAPKIVALNLDAFRLGRARAQA